MVVEHAELTITPGREAEFEEAFVRGHQAIAESPGYRWGRLLHQVEDGNRYLLLVGWDSYDAHMVDFRGSELFTRWRAAVGEYFASPVVVTHFEGDVDGTGLKGTGTGQ
jgi:heme-degrading monooxygenase HmoA